MHPGPGESWLDSIILIKALIKASILSRAVAIRPSWLMLQPLIRLDKGRVNNRHREQFGIINEYLSDVYQITVVLAYCVKYRGNSDCNYIAVIHFYSRIKIVE